MRTALSGPLCVCALGEAPRRTQLRHNTLTRGALHGVRHELCDHGVHEGGDAGLPRCEQRQQPLVPVPHTEHSVARSG